MTQKTNYQEKVEAQLRQWNTRIAELSDRVQAAEAGTQEKYQRQLRELTARRDEVERKLQKMRQAGEENWLDLRSSVEESLTDMEEQFDQVQATARSVGDTALGWAEGLAGRRAEPSSGWPEGQASNEEESESSSEGWAEGQGHREEGSAGWSEGMRKS